MPMRPSITTLLVLGFAAITISRRKGCATAFVPCRACDPINYRWHFGGNGGGGGGGGSSSSSSSSRGNGSHSVHSTMFVSAAGRRASFPTSSLALSNDGVNVDGKSDGANGPTTGGGGSDADKSIGTEQKRAEPSGGNGGGGGGGAVPSPELLQPFLPAADPMYAVRGPVGEGNFVISRLGGPTKEELSNENLLRILMIECSDLEVNTLVWKGLGYRFDPDNEKWLNDECFPKWREKYPDPPDFIGMRRIYSKEIDQPSLKANQALVRSVPVDNKQSLKTHLKPYGFKGYKYAELTPNKTRRAQCANWLLYYREELFGYTIDELKERRRIKQEAQEAEQKQRSEQGKNDAGKEWKPPVKEVF